MAVSKTVKDVLGEKGAEEGGVEFSVLVIGGAASVVKKNEGGNREGKVAQGASGMEVLRGEEFWGDLKGFLIQRLRDEGEGERVFGVFRKAWESGGK